MTRKYRDVLTKIANILHEAGWDQPEGAGDELASKQSHFFDPSKREVLASTLRDEVSPEKLTSRTGLPPDEGSGA